MPEARWLALTRGMFSLVDESDWHLVNRSAWFACMKTSAGRRYYYVVGHHAGEKVYLARHLLGITAKRLTVDHVNGDPLDNRRANLRVCLQRHNSRNRTKPNRPTSSRFKGVKWNPRNGNWNAQACVDYKTVHLGCFADEEAAARAYDAAAIARFGEFARLNFPVDAHSVLP